MSGGRYYWGPDFMSHVLWPMDSPRSDQGKSWSVKNAKSNSICLLGCCMGFHYPTLLSVSSFAVCGVRTLLPKLWENGLHLNAVYTSVFCQSDRSKGAFLLEGTTQATWADVYESITACVSPHRASAHRETAGNLGFQDMCTHTPAHMTQIQGPLSSPDGFVIHNAPF
jgi:hypothetical protein